MFHTYNYGSEKNTVVQDNLITGMGTLNPGPTGAMPSTVGRYEGELEQGRGNQPTDFQSAAYTPIVRQRAIPMVALLAVHKLFFCIGLQYCGDSISYQE